MAGPTKTWKSRERQVASFFGSKRTPLSGGNSGHTRSDSLSPYIFVENKYRKSHATYKLYEETRTKARKEHKVPVVTLCQKGTTGFLICVDSADLVAFIDAFIKAGLYPAQEADPSEPLRVLEELSSVPSPRDEAQDGPIQRKLPVRRSPGGQRS